MSWSLFVMPVHQAAHDGVLEWVGAASHSRGVPDTVPAAVPLPTVAEVLAAFRNAGCHGEAWFQVRDAGVSPPLTRCPDPASCGREGGLDIGEVTLRGAERADGRVPLTSATRVVSMSFRKPSRAGVLAAVCALASVSGPQLVFDDSADEVFVAWPNELEADLAREWPW
ncbi:hypothetical protein [Actinoplanes sp. NPDC049681]|uniref:hypothetical protein n=1 Tax=Actinoplanes sp. NPDC049681 TaxID=3363905 RepID=UPI003795ACFB